MIHYFKNVNNQTIEIDKPENDIWVNLTPPFKEEEFVELSEILDIPIAFLRDSLDIDERPRYEIDDNVKLIVIKTPTENASFNESNPSYITIPICIILTHNHIVTVNSFDNGAIKKFLNSFKKRQPAKRNKMVLKIVENVVQNFMEYLKEINQRRNKCELELTETNRNEELLLLMQLQKSLVYFVAALKSNELLMIKMERTNFLGLTEEERDYLQDLVVDTSQALEMANIYARIIDSTLATYNSLISNDLNKSIKKIAFVAIGVALFSVAIGLYAILTS